MSFTPIDYDTWERREYLEFFRKTTIYITTKVDITALYEGVKARGLRLYPALVYCAAGAVNARPEFRYAFGAAGEVGLWDVVHPHYTVPRKGSPQHFSMKYTPFAPNFEGFYGDFIRDYALAETCDRLLCDGALPKNICGVSIAPGIGFSAFSFSGDPKEDLTPFTVFGKFERVGGRVLLPVTGEFAHAVNDGWHIERFFESLEERAGSVF